MAAKQKKPARASKPRVAARPTSLGAQMIRDLRGLKTVLQSGRALESAYTVRTVGLVADPREYTPTAVRRTRDRLGASQAVFASMLGVSVRTVQAWEQGQAPSVMARRVLDMMNADPGPWIRLTQPVNAAG